MSTTNTITISVGPELSPAEAGALLGCGEQSVRKLVRAKRLRARAAHHRLYVDRESVEELLRERQAVGDAVPQS